MVLVAACDVLVLTVYVWLISIGTWTEWPSRWSLYDELATAFRSGQLALNSTPDPALLSLPNPYDPAARQGVPSRSDLSLYQGRYYVYFGPVPALILVLAKFMFPGPIGDQYLTFGFVAGIFLVQSEMIRLIWGTFFSDRPPWMLVPAILCAGLLNPWVWILNTPSIYTAAITSGVFFLLAGLFAALHALKDRRRWLDAATAWKLALTGVLWAAAIGSRITLSVPIAVLTLGIAVSLIAALRRNAAWRAVIPAAALVTPLVAGLVGLGWYNWARFGSFLETGIRYQLAGVPIQTSSGILYSPLYVVQNMVNYFFHTPNVKYAFPYFDPTRGLTRSVFPFIALPSLYHSQEVYGLLFSFTCFPLAIAPALALSKSPRVAWRTADEARQFRGVILALSAWFVCSFALNMAFFWVAERYMAEFMPPLYLLGIIGVFQVDRWLSSNVNVRWLFRVSFALISAACLITGIMAAMSFNSDGFRQLNPVLWRQLSNLFRP